MSHHGFYRFPDEFARAAFAAAAFQIITEIEVDRQYQKEMRLTQSIVDLGEAARKRSEDGPYFGIIKDITFAWDAADGDSVFELATAVCGPEDDFDSYEGVSRALKRLRKGQTIFVPIDYSTGETLVECVDGTLDKMFA